MNSAAWVLSRRFHAASSPLTASLRLSRASLARPTSTSASLGAGRRKSAPTSEERLFQLRSSEKRVAVFAVGSLVVGYITLKVAFSDLTSAKPKERKQNQKSGSGTRMGLHRPLVVAGPSGSGKSTLLRLLFKDHPHSFGFSVSHTTRKPRAGEVDGRDYHFVTREEMKRKIDAGDFIEWAQFSGNMYGTSKQTVTDVQLTGKICVLDIDVQGVQSMKKTQLNPLYVFIKPPSIEELEKRLRLRKTESEDSLQRRLQRSKDEMSLADIPGMFDYTIVNDDLQKAYLEFKTTLTDEIMNSDTTDSSTKKES